MFSETFTYSNSSLPVGCMKLYPYGFNGQEKDDEISGSGNHYTAEFWEYDPRTGRRWNIDPIRVAWESPYAAFRNNPIVLNDPNGDCLDCDEEDGGGTETESVGPVKPKSVPMEGVAIPKPPAPERKDVKDLSASNDVVDFIKSKEGLRLEMYDDDAGYATIGYGHLIHYGKVGTDTKAEKPFKNGITDTEAVDLLKTDIENKAEKFVRSNVKVKLSQNEYDALVSFTFNVGGGALKRSTLLKKVNAGETNAATIKSAFVVWNKAGGKELKGLTKRRQAEAEIFINNKY